MLSINKKYVGVCVIFIYCYSTIFDQLPVTAGVINTFQLCSILKYKYILPKFALFSKLTNRSQHVEHHAELKTIFANLYFQSHYIYLSRIVGGESFDNWH